MCAGLSPPLADAGAADPPPHATPANALIPTILAAIPQERPEARRTPIAASTERRTRTVDQRLLLRLPQLTEAYVRWIGARPAGSLLRRVAIRRGVQLGVEAYNRRDLEAAVIGWHPDFEYRPGRDWVSKGLVAPCYRGLDGYREYAKTADRIENGALYLRRVELIDLGERILILADAPSRAQPSDAPPRDPFATLAKLRQGQVIRVQEYFDHDEALAAAGAR